MSKIIASAAIRGARKIFDDARRTYQGALEKYGPEQEIGFPNTAYYLPIIYGITGIPVQTLGDCQPVLRRSRQILPPGSGLNRFLCGASILRSR